MLGIVPWRVPGLPDVNTFPLRGPLHALRAIYLIESDSAKFEIAESIFLK
jgi:hypothetical protein